MKNLIVFFALMISLSPSCFGWSFRSIWWPIPKPLPIPPVIDNGQVNKKIQQLAEDVSTIKQDVVDVEQRMNGLDNEVVKIGQDVTKIGQDVQAVKAAQESAYDQLTLYVDDKISNLPTSGELPGERMIPFTVDGEYIGNVIGMGRINIISNSPDNYTMYARVEINKDFFPIWILMRNGMIYNAVESYYYPGASMTDREVLFSDQENCQGNKYSDAGMYTAEITDQPSTQMVLPQFKGKMYNFNGEIYYRPKHPDVIKLSSDSIKSVYYDYSCREHTPSATYDYHLYKLFPNDPEITGVHKYPFNSEVLLDGHPIPFIQY